MNKTLKRLVEEAINSYRRQWEMWLQLKMTTNQEKELAELKLDLLSEAARYLDELEKK